VVTAQHRLLSSHLHNEICALAMIGYALRGEAEEAERFVAIAEEKARLTLEHAPTDGAWPEGVSYWGYGLSYFLRMLEAKRRLGRGDDFAGNAWLRSTGDYFVGPGHAHPDINSFSIFARGQWLAVDPGYSRVKDTRDHSTVIVNGKGQAGEGGAGLDYWAFQQRQPAPAILRAESTREYDTVLADAGGFYVDGAWLRHFRRQVLFLKPDVFVIADDLAAHGSSRFEWLLHAPEGCRGATPHPEGGGGVDRESRGQTRRPRRSALGPGDLAVAA
jgi:hypothetical protein